MSGKISGMQCGVILFLTTISLKFLVFPSLFSKYAYRDVYFSVFLGLMIDLIFTIIVLKVISKNPHLTFKELITRSMGSIAAKTIMLLLFIHFFVKGIVIIKETHNYFNETLFEDIDWLFFIAPLFLLMAFMMLKDFRTIGRSLQFFGLIILGSLLFTIILPATEAKLSNLLPLFENGVAGIFKALFFCSFSFGDFLILFLLMGNIDYKKGTSKTILTYLICADVLIVTFYMVFSGIFGNLGLNHSLALSELIMYTSISTSTGTINWLNIMIWLIILFFEMGVMFNCSSKLLGQVFNFKTKYPAMFIVLTLILLSVIYLYLSLIKTLDIITSVPFVIYSLLIQISIPVLCVIATKLLSGKHRVTIVDVYNTPVIKYQLTDIYGVVVKDIYSNKLTSKKKKPKQNLHKGGEVQNA